MYRFSGKSKKSHQVLRLVSMCVCVCVCVCVCFFTPKQYVFKRNGYLGRISAMLYKGDNFCDFLFIFLLTKSLKRGLL